MLTFEILKSDTESQEIINKSGIEDIIIMNTKTFEGNTEILSFLAPLAIPTLKILGEIVIKLIASKNKVTIKYEGVELTGINQKNVLDILTKLKDDK